MKWIAKVIFFCDEIPFFNFAFVSCDAFDRDFAKMSDRKDWIRGARARIFDTLPSIHFIINRRVYLTHTFESQEKKNDANSTWLDCDSKSTCVRSSSSSFVDSESLNFRQFGCDASRCIRKRKKINTLRKIESTFSLGRFPKIKIQKRKKSRKPNMIGSFIEMTRSPTRAAGCFLAILRIRRHTRVPFIFYTRRAIIERIKN